MNIKKKERSATAKGFFLVLLPLCRNRIHCPTGFATATGNLTVGIIEIAEMDTLSGADLLTRSRWHPVLDAMHAECALVRGAASRIDVPGFVGAGGDAGLAPGALLGVQLDRAPGPVVGRACGANLHARGVVAVIAPLGFDGHSDVRVHALEKGVDPIP